MRVGGTSSPYDVIFAGRKRLRHIDAEGLCRLRRESAKAPVFSIDGLEFYTGQLHRVVEGQDEDLGCRDEVAVGWQG